jgi:hypothetical protein
MIGYIDDLQVYGRILVPGELRYLSSGEESGIEVAAGNDQTIALPNSATLSGTVNSWGTGTPSTTWAKISGPGTVTFANPNSPATTATFSQEGTYTLELTGTLGSKSDSDTITVTVMAAGSIIHRYVRVRQSSQYLTLAEVEVREKGTNTILQTQSGTSATQSSEGWGGAAPRGKDGNTNQSWGAGTSFHTLNGASEWWLLDLGGPQNIGSIKLYNRSDCCSDRLNGAIAEILDGSQNPVWTSPPISGATPGSTHEFTIP